MVPVNLDLTRIWQQKGEEVEQKQISREDEIMFAHSITLLDES